MTHNTDMRIRRFIATLVIFLTIGASARPVRPGHFVATQPDGSTFTAVCIGDEFLKIIKTTQGHTIVKDSDGWWCYAIYNADGSRYSSGRRVGSQVSSDILSRSLDIPYEALKANAAAKRAVFQIEEENILKRTLKGRGVRLMAEEDAIVKHGLVILAQYKDIKFRSGHKEDQFAALLTEKGYSDNGATGSVKDYFDSQFGGMFEFEFEVSPIVTLDNHRAYYGQNDRYGNDLRPAEMVAEACQLAHDASVNFAKYDDDGDGYVDNVFVLFAGEDEADNPTKDADCIWSHSWYVESGAGIKLKLDGKVIDQYACTSELMVGDILTGIGTFCHEFAHTLGLPDLYDTDYEESGGWAAGMWNSTSLMDGGNQNNWYKTPPYFNAIERELLGLSEPIMIEHNGQHTLRPINESGQYYKIAAEIPTEYYLIECRSNNGWDAHIGGSGMLVYHVEKNRPGSWKQNTVNVNPNYQHADLIEADGREDNLNQNNYFQATQNISSIFFPYANVTELTPDSDPGIKFWRGGKVDTRITDIMYEDGVVTFIVSGLKGEVPPTPKNLKADPYMDAAIITFESDRPYDGEAKVTWGKVGEEGETLTVTPYETGKYCLILEELTPGNKTYTISVCFESEGIESPSKKASFMTSKAAPITWPYIHLGKNVNKDGTLNIGAKMPLMVYNASSAEIIEWEFNGKAVSPAGDGYFTITEGGVLRATVYWPEGGTDTLEKLIILSE